MSSTPSALIWGELSLAQVHAVLEGARQSPTECDGCSRLVAHELVALGIGEVLIMIGRYYNAALNFWVVF